MIQSVLSFWCVKGGCPVTAYQERTAGEEIKMQLDIWSVIAIVVVVIGFFGGIWYEHR